MTLRRQIGDRRLREFPWWESTTLAIGERSYNPHWPELYFPGSIIKLSDFIGGCKKALPNEFKKHSENIG